MKVAIAVTDGVFASGVTLLHDTLAAAERLRPSVDPALAPIEVVIAADRPLVRTGSEFGIPASLGFDALGACDVVVVPGLGAFDERRLDAALAASDVKRLARGLAELEGTRVAAACTGSFVLADAGVLDGRRATTSWWLAGLLAQRYPLVAVDAEQMVVRDGPTVTAGAAYAHVDLALALLESISGDLAARAANYLLIDRRPAQSVYVAIDHISRLDPLVADFERHVRANLSGPLSVEEVARAIGTTRRTLERRVKDAAGTTPLSLIQRIRAQRAAHLLSTTDASVEAVAADVGYANASTLRALLRRHRRATPAPARTPSRPRRRDT